MLGANWRQIMVKRYDVELLKLDLGCSIQSFCLYLFPNGKYRNRTYCVGSLKGEPGSSLKICLSGENVCVWKDFATGEGGNNLLDLLHSARGGSFTAACREAANWLSDPDRYAVNRDPLVRREYGHTLDPGQKIAKKHNSYDFGPWECSRARKTLYVDGEMPLKSMQDRLILLDPAPSEDLYLLSHDDLAEAELIFNLCKEYQQEWLLEYCMGNGIGVVFLDNPSCLCFGMKENEADSWEQVLGWLLRFRRAGIAVVIIHHANGDGNGMWGTSRREDAAFWVVKIPQNRDFSEMRIGTTFTSSFTKNRDDGSHREKSIDWSFVTTNDHTAVTWRPTDTKDLAYELIKNGVDSNADIAAELGITRGTVSFHIGKLIAENFIKKQGARYVLYYGREPQ
jgi:hypothetical protein